MTYNSPYEAKLDEDIKHAERVINGSALNTKWWIEYRHNLLRLLLQHQLYEFSK